MDVNSPKVLELECRRREDSGRETADCGARAANVRDRREPFHEDVAAIQTLSRAAYEDTFDRPAGNPRRLTQLTSRTMGYPSETKVTQTKCLIGRARDALAQFHASLFHTQQLIDASIQQIQEIQELLSRIGQIPDLMKDREALRSGMGDRANNPAKHREAPRP